MATVVKPFTFSNGTVADALEVNSNFDTLYNLVNGNLDQDNLAANSVNTSELVANAVTYAKLNADVTDRMVPVGSIIPFYDFGTGGPGSSPLTFSSTYWAYCDGSSVTLNGSGSFATPDMSNRYLVGFGTEGGGDIDTATWATAAVGNASHQINLQHSHTVDGHTHDVDILSFSSASDGDHSHTVDSHTHDVNIAAFTSASGGSHSHTVNSHTHTGPSHSHTAGSLVALLYNGSSGTSDGIYFKSDTATAWNADRRDDAGGIQATYPTGVTSGVDINGSTANGGTGATGASSPGTDSQGSHTHSIDPPNTTSTGSTPGTDTQGAHTHTIDPPNTTSTSTSPGTDSQLSTTQSIQPRSIRVRHIMRIA